MLPIKKSFYPRILMKPVFFILLCFIPLKPDYILSKSIAGTNGETLQNRQQLAKGSATTITSNKIPQVIVNRMMQGTAQEFIVLFEAQDVNIQASEMRLKKSLKFDNQNIIDFKANQFSMIKQKVMRTFSSSDMEMIEDYSQLPMAFIRCKSMAGLKQLINNPLVKGIYENKSNKAFLSESLPLVNQPPIAANGFNGAGTTVAVLDSGLDYTRSAFGSCTAPGVPANCRVVHAQEFAPNDFRLDDSPTKHGTNVAGIVLGVAPKTKIAALDVFGFLQNGDFKASDNNIISAINWVIANKMQYNIVAMNLSLGGGKYIQECKDGNPYTMAFSLARSAGVLPVVAAGNDGHIDAIAKPACTPGAVSIGAVYDANVGTQHWSRCTDNLTAPDQAVCFSNSASFMTILAPGALINAAGILQGGTSQAAPHVTGAIAVLRAANAFSEESLDQTVTRLTSTGKPITDPRNQIVKPRLDLLAAIDTEFSSSPVPEIGNQSGSLQLFNALGVTTDSDGNIYVHYDKNNSNVVSKFTPAGVIQWTTPIGGFFDIGLTGHLTIDPISGQIVDLLSTGQLIVLDPQTGTITNELDFRSLFTIDASNVYDVASGSIMNMTNQILLSPISYGDVSIHQKGDNFNVFAAGFSTISKRSFVIRFRFVAGQPIEAKVLIASIISTGNQNGGTSGPRGVAVNNQGDVLTSLPVLACSTCTFAKDVGITFDVDYEPTTDPSPTIILNRLDLRNHGIGTDSTGNFYLATGTNGTTFCGQAGTGALIVVSKSMDNVSCGSIGVSLLSSNDVALNPTDNTVYMTVSSRVTFFDGGLLVYPVTQSPVVIDKDGDGVPDVTDNCPNHINPTQLNSDNDAKGNVCDFDDDNDGLPDHWELANGTNPLIVDADADIDNDDLSNLEEFQAGTNPQVADTDSDGISDGYEIINQLNPFIDDSTNDPDNDGLTNIEEFLAGTNPRKADTDNDGIPDPFEVMHGLNPLVNDADIDNDNDGLTNFQEFQAGTDPKDNDTDNDGILDGVDPDPLVKVDDDFCFPIKTLNSKIVIICL